MQYSHLGRSGLRVSRLCLGTMNFGPFTSETEAFALMDRAVELGLNFFDTADVYGRKRGEGVTESIIGRWFAQGGSRRDYVVLATKVFGMMDRPERPDPNLDRGLSARKIIRNCEASLSRLQTDRIDLYQMHHIDRTCPFDEWLGAMETLRHQGKIYYVGSSNFAGWDLATACTTADLRAQPRLISEQSLYNLASRMIELEVIPACQHFGVGLIPWSPLGGGLLGGVLAKAAGGRRAAPDFQKQIDAKRPQLERYENLCRQLGTPPGDVALAWLLAQPVVTAPIIGPRTMAQLTDAMRALDLTLTPETLHHLDEIFPGPGGSAPEAYAW